MIDQSELAKEYQLRFKTRAEYRTGVWRVLCSEYFQQFVRRADAVLDLGCGWGEFINHIEAGRKFAIDLNPDSPKHLSDNVTFFHQDCSTAWPLPDDSLDVVFTSNFFEHLPSKPSLTATVGEAWRCLKKEGLLICLGPNINCVGGAYWDFYDHYLPLTEQSLEELLQIAGFQSIQARRRFLPYTMARGWQPPVVFLQVYLKLAFVWPLLGKQFLVIGRK